MRLALFALAALLLLAGCSSQAWYAGFQTRQRQACFELPAAERAACLEQASLSYADYRQARQERYESR